MIICKTICNCLRLSRKLLILLVRADGRGIASFLSENVMSTIPPNTSALGGLPTPTAFRRIPRKVQNHLRTLRSERGLTLQQVSEGTGLSISTLHAIENEQEREATLATAFKLARFYGLAVEKIWQPLYQQICQEAEDDQIWPMPAARSSAHK